MKKLLSLALAAVMFLSFLMPFSVYASEAKDALPIMMENPFLSGERYLTGDIDSVVSEKSASRTYNNQVYYSQGKELFAKMRKGLLNHKGSIKTKYLSDSNLTPGGIIMSTLALKSFIFEMMYYATEDEASTSCVDGDYLRYSMLEFGISDINLDTYKNGKYFYTIVFAVKYNATVEELKKTDSAVNSFVNSIDTNSLSDYEIIKKIHDYICSKTSYDYDAAEVPPAHPYAFSPYGALVKGKCVCQGYATAFYRICKELGYKTRVVISDPNQGNHAWNIVELDGKFYFVDCTWDDMVLDEDIDEIPVNFYFLVSYATTLTYDSSNQHVLDSEYFDTDYFNSNYRKYFASSNYDRENLSLLSRCKVTLSQKSYTFDGKAKTPAVTVKDGNGALLENGVDYTLAYSGNTNTGYPCVTVYGKGDYNGDKTKRRFIIKPAKANKPSASTGAVSAKLKWKASGGSVTGYAIETYTDGSWKSVKTTTECSAVIVGLSPAKKYRFRIRAYKDISKRRYYGDYSAQRECSTKPKKVKGVTLTAAKRKLTVNYKKVKCTGYIIQYSPKKNMKGAKEIRIKDSVKLSKTVKKLKSNERYYVRVRAYHKYKINGKTKTAYGKWSAKKSIKIK